MREDYYQPSRLSSLTPIHDTDPPILPIPIPSAEDALQISLATVHGMDFLLTWNFRHINNVEMKARIRTVIDAVGFECPVICSPEELGGVEL